jgi:shikimate kinase
MKIFLLGMPGSGKSTLGKQLASHLQVPFLDLDQLIQERVGMSIPDFFSARGEEAFREQEQITLQSAISDIPKFVMATGGGAPCFFQNMDEMNRAGVTIYLKPSRRALAERLHHDGLQHRPLFAGLSMDAFLQKLADMEESRKEYYQKAKVILEGDDLRVSSILERLANVKS